MSGTHPKPRRRQGAKAQRSYATVSGLPPATVSGERRNLDALRRRVQKSPMLCAGECRKSMLLCDG
jgi:hypothetical protein